MVYEESIKASLVSPIGISITLVVLFILCWNTTGNQRNFIKDCFGRVRYIFGNHHDIVCSNDKKTLSRIFHDHHDITVSDKITTKESIIKEKKATQHVGAVKLHCVWTKPKIVADSPCDNISTPLIVLIPGNPGVPGFYQPFMEHLFELGSQNLNICCVSHTGHSKPELNYNNHLNVFDFKDQISHKIDFVLQKLQDNKTMKIILVGHSVGAYICIQILKRFPSQVSKLVLLQPTLMDIRKTPNGIRMNPMFTYHKMLSKLFYIPQKLPKFLQNIFAKIVMGKVDHPVLIDSAVAVANPIVVQNALKMALHEMHELLDLDEEIILEHQSKILFLYSSFDGWVPSNFVSHYQDVFNEAKHLVVKEPHAFMLSKNGSENIAGHTWNWIKEDIIAQQSL